ncbi:hypothetical protein FRB90_012742, partial [Tulasnella sp. 427]
MDDSTNVEELLEVGRRLCSLYAAQEQSFPNDPLHYLLRTARTAVEGANEMLEQ